MEETKYEVYMGNQLIATNMDLSVALVLIKALAEEYYNSMAFGEKLVLKAVERHKCVEESDIIDKLKKYQEKHSGSKMNVPDDSGFDYSVISCEEGPRQGDVMQY